MLCAPFPVSRENESQSQSNKKGTKKQTTEPKAVSRTEEPEEVRFAAANVSDQRGRKAKQSKQTSSLQLSEVKLKDWILVIWFVSAYKLLPTRLNWRQCDCLWKQGVNTIQIWSEIVFKANFNPWYFQKCQLTLFESADILPTKPRSKPSYN